MTYLMRAEAPPEIAGQFLADYDVDFLSPEDESRTGYAIWTTEPARAIQFESLEAGMEAWKRQSKSVPKRPDGLPNRPLTAFTISFIPWPSQEAPSDGYGY